MQRRRVMWSLAFLAGVGLGGSLFAAETARDHLHDHASEADVPQTEPPAAKNGSGWMLTLLVVYCGLIVAASLVGGWIPSWAELTHTNMQTLISGVGGLMLGIAVFHLLPHSLEYTASAALTSRWLMGGLLVMFFLVRAFHFHHHGPADPLAENAGHHHDPHDHAEAHHDHGHPHAVHHLNWIGVALGLALHTMIDGMALGASVRADVGEAVFLSLFGFGTFLAVLLHKPLDAISITSLMAAGGWSAAPECGERRLCLDVPAGRVAVCARRGAIRRATASGDWLVLAFAAGVFLCISLGDLLPELELHSHNRVRLSVALLLGVALAWAIEQTHSHHHPEPDDRIPQVREEVRSTGQAPMRDLLVRHHAASHS